MIELKLLIFIVSQARTNTFYAKKLNESKKIFRYKSWILSAYRDLCENFYLVPFWRFKIEKKLFDAILPLRVWNHKVLCVRSQYESNMCLCFVQKYTLEIRRCQS